MSNWLWAPFGISTKVLSCSCCNQAVSACDHSLIALHGTVGLFFDPDFLKLFYASTHGLKANPNIILRSYLGFDTKIDVV